jgi:hypothetical protein
LGASGGFPRIKEILENYLPYPEILLKAVLGFPQKFTGQKGVLSSTPFLSLFSISRTAVSARQGK